MQEYIINACQGCAIAVKKDQLISVIDVEGGQVADFFAEIKDNPDEYVSPSVTMDCNESLHVGVGTVLYSNLYRPMFRVVYDDVEAHDLLFPACSKAMYDFFYHNGEGHPSCLNNINGALGRNRNTLHPINIFMNTHVEPNGKVIIEKPKSKAGDKIVLVALDDCVLGISACSVSESDTNSGKCSSIKVIVEG